MQDELSLCLDIAIARYDALVKDTNKLKTECDRMKEALESAKTFIEYTRYELKESLIPFAQFPSKECADKEISKISEALESRGK